MEKKSLTFTIAGFLAFVFLISFASATITLSTVPELSQTGNSFTITVGSNETETVTLSAPDISDGTHIIKFTPKNVVLNGNSSLVTVFYDVPLNFEFEFLKDYKTTLSASGNVSPSAVIQTLTFEDSDFCEVSNPGELRVKISDVKVISGFGDDEEWLPFDEVEVELEIENRGDEDIDDITIEWGLYNEESDEWTIEVDDLKDFNLKDGDEEVMTFTFEINDKMDQDLEDLEEGTYILYVRATGEVDNSSNFKTCASDSENAKIFIERDFVVFANTEILPENVQCGSNVHLSAEVWNIGNRDQDDVYVRIVNYDLGINEKIIVGDINAFDNEAINFYFDVPKDLDEKEYYLTLTVYDEDDDVYENDYNDESSIDFVSFIVKGNCAVAEVGLSAVLQSGGEAGEPLVVKASIVNSGQKSTNYVLNAASYADWASSASLEATTFTLAPGETKEVLITLDVKDDAEGTHIFNLEVLAEGELIANQPVQVTITDSGFKFPKISAGNWHLWAIGALNVILVILIIVIAVRIARK